MAEEKEEKILDELKRRAEDVKFGKIVVEFTIHQGKITAGEIVDQRIKLG